MQDKSLRQPRSSDSIPADDIAIVGIGCRLAGGIDSPDAFWKLVREGADGIVDVPAERWDVSRYYDPDHSKPGKFYVRRGGFLKQSIYAFDAMFFGISPREAGPLDPQQRMLLEVAWEALEDSGIPPDSLVGSQTGVFIGGFIGDNQLTQQTYENRDHIVSQTAVSSTLTMLSNRISYTLDLRGPSVSMDTACSSSLVAIHIACESLRRGESTLALAGGSNIMFRPETIISLCKGQFLAEDGRSKSFDSRADGYGRGEGAAIIILKSLQQAVADGDRIYAVIRGSGVNQDGRTDGITVPNADAQKELMRRVCDSYGVDPMQVDYVEAHGTGTPVGDPLEASAIGEVYGRGRAADQPLPLGSVKANIGHTEAAAGVAGTIKSALSLFHREIPPLANLQEPNPGIDFTDLGLKLPRQVEPLPQLDRDNYAAVNSFGYGGTNAHIILRNRPQPVAASAANPQPLVGPCLLPISARSEAALQRLTERYIELLERVDGPSLAAICAAASKRRAHLNYRLAVTAESKEEAALELRAYLQDQGGTYTFSARTDHTRPVAPVFVFTGMGPQWWGMGRELYAQEPVFRNTADQCDAIFKRLAGWSILEEMQKPEAASRMAETQIAQPANFVVQVALAALLDSWGVRPGAIVGHSVGEVSAAYVAGALSLEDGVKVSYHRSRIQQSAAGSGKMLAVGATPEQLAPLLQGLEDKVAIAAINGPSTLTLAGDGATIDLLAKEVEARGWFGRLLRVEVPYHSPRMDPLLPEVRDSLAGIEPHMPGVELYSTVTGDRVVEAAHDPEYWCRNVRQPVLFAQAIQSLYRDGHEIFIEIGPNPVLASSIKEVLLSQGGSASVVASLRRDTAEPVAMRKALAAMFVRGAAIAWDERFGANEPWVDLPKYPWQREHYWQEPAILEKDRRGMVDHPLLGLRVLAPQPTWEQRVSNVSVPYVADHQVDGLVILPGAAYVEAGLAIGAIVLERPRQVLTDVSFHGALVIDAHTDQMLRATYHPADQRVEIFSRVAVDGERWTHHASATVSLIEPAAAAPVDLDAVRSRCATSLDPEAVYAELQQRKLNYGPAFRGLQEIYRGTGEALVRIKLPEGTAAAGYHLHPSLLDAAFQSIVALIDEDVGRGQVYVPVAIGQLRLHAEFGAEVWAVAKLVSQNEKEIRGHLTLCDAAGNVLAEVRSLACRALARASEDSSAQDDLFYEVNWSALGLPELADSDGPSERWLVFCDPDGFGERLADYAESTGNVSVVRVFKDAVETETSQRHVLPVASDEAMDVLLHQIGPTDKLVYCWGMAAQPVTADVLNLGGISLFNQVIKGLGRVLADRRPVPRFYLVTRNAIAVLDDDAVAGLNQAPLIGIAQVALNEYSALRMTTIDIDEDSAVSLPELLTSEVKANSDESTIAIRNKVRYVQRLNRLRPDGSDAANDKDATVELSPDRACFLEIGKSGQLGSLRFREMARRAPGPGEIEIAIKAVGLNFKDVAKVMGIMNEEALEGTYFGHGLGMEAAGTVLAVGAGVTNIRSGARLVFNIPDCFRSHMTVPVEGLHFRELPDRISFEDAAGVPTVFITVHYALLHVARLQRNETVLIHSAAGGVGLSAIQVAQHVGAKIIATAGSPEKVEYLRSLGVEHVFHSRSLNFAEEVFAVTGGRGVDVVLNSLSGEFIAQSLAVLAPFGRFIELGKRDIVENNRLPLKAFNENLLFASVDVDRLTALRPDYVEDMLTEVYALVLSGDYRPLRTKVFSAAEVVDAFSYMARAQQIGKVVVSMDSDQGIHAIPLVQEAPLWRADATYLITGGFGGFGLAIAHSLVASGVRHLALVGRNGAASASAQEAVRSLQEAGAKVLVLSADVAERQSVAKMLAEIDRQMPPLKGILHSAGVLDDAPMAELTAERFERVMRPKVLGAWNLHLETQKAGLEQFVLFSSVAALIGNTRQANYVAGNAFLDSLPYYRRALGLAGVSVNWGAIADAGMAADEQVKVFLEMMGLIPMVPATAFAAFNRVARLDKRQLAIAGVDWARWSGVEPATSSTPRFSQIIERDNDGFGNAELRRTLTALEYPERLDILGFALAEQVGETLRIPVERVELGKALNDLGMDSLMAAELQASIRTKLGAEVSTLELLKGGSITDLAEQLLVKMQLGKDADAQQSAAEPAKSKAVSVDDLSDEEVDKLLAAKLSLGA